MPTEPVAPAEVPAEDAVPTKLPATAVEAPAPHEEGLDYGANAADIAADGMAAHIGSILETTLDQARVAQISRPHPHPHPHPDLRPDRMCRRS